MSSITDQFFGQIVRLKSFNFPGQYLRYRDDNTAWIDPFKVDDLDDSSAFRIIAGLNSNHFPNSVSLESVEFPGKESVGDRNPNHQIKIIEYAPKASHGPWPMDPVTLMIPVSIDQTYLKLEGRRESEIISDVFLIQIPSTSYLYNCTDSKDRDAARYESWMVGRDGFSAVTTGAETGRSRHRDPYY